MEKENKKDNFKKIDVIKKYNIDLDSLKREQIKLARGLEIKDKIDFSLSDRFASFDNTFISNKILCCVIVCNKEFEVIDRSYVYEKVKFPYIPGFRNYRELIHMISAYEKLNEKADVVFIPAQGITHQRLGLASHFGLSISVPAIGVSNSVVECEIVGDDIIKNGKKVGKLFISKEGSKPMYVSPGNLISVESALMLCKKLVRLPHKYPEPMHLASKYSREVQKEVNGT